MKNKIKEWMRRYLLADILSTVLSLATAWVIYRTTVDNVLAAFGGSAMGSFSKTGTNLLSVKKIYIFRNLFVTFI
jgi:hypothetical protein